MSAERIVESDDDFKKESASPVRNSLSYEREYQDYRKRQGTLGEPLFQKILGYQPSPEEIDSAHLYFACNQMFKGAPDTHTYRTLASLIQISEQAERRFNSRDYHSHRGRGDVRYLARELSLLLDYYPKRENSKLEAVSPYPSSGHWV